MAILSNSFFLTFSEIVTKASKLLFFIYIAQLGKESLGIYNYIFNFLTIFVVVGEFGVNTYITREQSKISIFPNKNLLALSSFKILFTIFLFTISFFIYFEEKIVFFLIASILIGDILLLNSFAFYRANQNFKLETIFKVSQALIYIISSILGFLIELEFIELLTLVALFNTTLAIFSMLKLSNFSNYFKRFKLKYLTVIYKKKIYEILPLFLASIFTTIYFRIDILMLEAMINLESVGIYSVAFKLFESAMILPWMLSIVFLPRLSKSKTLNFKRDILLYFIIGFIIFIAFFYTVEFFIKLLFSSEYEDSIIVAKILSISIIPITLNSYLFTLLNAKNLSKYNAIIAFFMCLANIYVNLLLIPKYGEVGASVATILTEIVGTFALFAIFYFKKGILLK